MRRVVRRYQRRDWTIVFLPGGHTESRSFRVRAAPAAAVAAAIVVLLLSAGWIVGAAWEQRSESKRTRELEAELERLSAERTQVMELAARLERMEVDYQRLQRVLGSDGSDTSTDGMWLPPLELGEGSAAATGREGRLQWPLAQRGYITRSHRTDAGLPHGGIDIAIPAGSYVRASAPGIVADVGENGIYGRFVRIEHAGDLSTLYGHNAWTFVTAGDSVEAREVIAVSGSTGRSTGPHLHFETRLAGRMIDPLELVGR